MVRDFTGHGVGRQFPLGLVIPHYDAAPDYATVMSRDGVHDRTDADPRHPRATGNQRMGRVGRRLDRHHARPSRTAQFEHTLVVTERGAEILTLRDGGIARSTSERRS